MAADLLYVCVHADLVSGVSLGRRLEVGQVPGAGDGDGDQDGQSLRPGVDCHLRTRGIMACGDKWSVVTHRELSLYGKTGASALETKPEVSIISGGHPPPSAIGQGLEAVCRDNGQAAISQHCLQTKN